MTSPVPVEPATTLLRHFPLVPRPQPDCPPLPRRIRRVARLAAQSAPNSVAAAHNLAALAAADCGHLDLARDLCWLHHHRYPRDQPWTDPETRRALEPLINLARLHAHTGAPDTALTLLHELFTAHHQAGDAILDGQLVVLRHLRPGTHDHSAARRWLWGVVLTEGIRALTRAARWDDAHAHARRHRGVGARLLDGRQTAIIAAHHRGDCATAVELLDTTTLGEPWEHLVHRILRAAVDGRGDRNVLRAVDTYLAFTTDPSNSLFTLRLGLVLRPLAHAADPVAAARVTIRLASLAHCGDGYHARDLLAGGVANHLPDALRCQLEAARASGLQRSIPGDELRTRLYSALGGDLS